MSLLEVLNLFAAIFAPTAALLGWFAKMLWDKVVQNTQRVTSLEKGMKGIHSHLLQLDEAHNPAPGCPYCVDAKKEQEKRNL